MLPDSMMAVGDALAAASVQALNPEPMPAKKPPAKAQSRRAPTSKSATHKKSTTRGTTRPSPKRTQASAKPGPNIFRVMLQVSNLDRAGEFYSRLLGSEGRKVGGGRMYFDCGPVILGLLDPQKKPTPNVEDLFFSVDNVEEIHARARALGCLSDVDVHGESGAELLERPWGERSFYCEDPFGNGLCFVDARTLFTGR
jgi:catechol 2,3-dioxygenase-like lactoylglutathione lyase family enzyme